jgi:hypothetical protein
MTDVADDHFDESVHIPEADRDGQSHGRAIVTQIAQHKSLTRLRAPESLNLTIRW